MAHRNSLTPLPPILITAAILIVGCSCLIQANSYRPTAFDLHASSSGVLNAFPLKVSENHRYLVDQHGRPFRIQGDSAQSLIANLTYAEADTYLTDRRNKGFNAVNINLLERKFAIDAPKNRRGDSPFTVADNFAAPNDAYFDFADSIIELAASKGMLVSLAAMYLGYGGGAEGWWSTLTNAANTQTVCYNFGFYVGKRYKNRANILWVIGGDFTPPPGSEGEKRLQKFMQGIKAAGASQLWSGDWHDPCISTDVRAFAPEMDVNAVYTYGINGKDGLTYGESRVAYKYSPARPAYLKETGYEEETLLPGDPTSVRKYQYWAVLGGATAGAFFGHRDIWDFATSRWSSGLAPNPRPWQTALNSTGAFDMKRLGTLLDSTAWYKLVPSGMGGMQTLVTAGGGTYGKGDYVTAAAAADRSLLLAYLPPEANSAGIAVSMSALAAPAKARWFDPTSAIFINIPGDSFPNSGSRTFSIPGNNAAGARDWVLVVETNKNFGH
ncbi:MAG: hypothetical protein JWO71_1151 [Candidatus Acidoferrum typicum]|nr:hypothetical protein [Candidatus Acidoferrum typicum]